MEEEKKKRGRPKLGDAVLSYRFRVRLTQGIGAKLEQQAYDRGVTTNSLIREDIEDGILRREGEHLQDYEPDDGIAEEKPQRRP